MDGGRHPVTVDQRSSPSPHRPWPRGCRACPAGVCVGPSRDRRRLTGRPVAAKYPDPALPWGLRPAAWSASTGCSQVRLGLLVVRHLVSDHPDDLRLGETADHRSSAPSRLRSPFTRPNDHAKGRSRPRTLPEPHPAVETYCTCVAGRAVTGRAIDAPPPKHSTAGSRPLSATTFPAPRSRSRRCRRHPYRPRSRHCRHSW